MPKTHSIYPAALREQILELVRAAARPKILPSGSNPRRKSSATGWHRQSVIVVSEPMA
jgi:hypothetical protein